MATFKKASDVKPGMKGVMVHMSKQEFIALAAILGHCIGAPAMTGQWYDNVFKLYKQDPSKVYLDNPFQEDAEPHLEPFYVAVFKEHDED